MLHYFISFVLIFSVLSSAPYASIVVFSYTSQPGQSQQLKLFAAAWLGIQVWSPLWCEIPLIFRYTVWGQHSFPWPVALSHWTWPYLFCKAFSSCCIFGQFISSRLGVSLWRLNRQLSLQLIYYKVRYTWILTVAPSPKYFWIGFECQSALFQEPWFICLSFRFCFHQCYSIVWFWWNFEFSLISV